MCFPPTWIFVTSRIQENELLVNSYPIIRSNLANMLCKDNCFVLLGINSIIVLMIRVMKLSAIIYLHVSQLQLVVFHD